MALRVIRTREEAKAHNPHEFALIEVPGQWLPVVMALIKSLPRTPSKYSDSGLVVTNIGPGSQAARAGMARGDVLLRYDGVRLDSAATLKHLTKRFTQGAASSKRIIIDATRGEKKLHFEVRGGRLGITVGASFHRSPPTRHSRRRRRSRQDAQARRLDSAIRRAAAAARTQIIVRN
jgi:hypothetical protein